jgi:hypothetical protein
VQQCAGYNDDSDYCDNSDDINRKNSNCNNDDNNHNHNNMKKKNDYNDNNDDDITIIHSSAVRFRAVHCTGLHCIIL